MSNSGYKILAKFCREKGVTDAHKEGILFGMHIMALQTEKWLDNEEHATSYRMDTWDECGFSGWREIYEHTKGFLEAKQPDDSDMRVFEDDEGYDEESDVSDMEFTDDDEFELVDNEDEGSDEEDEEDEESDWTPYTFENVEYLVGPDADLGRVVLETEDYQPVGVFEDDKIVFEDNNQFENHLERVRRSTIPEDEDEAQELLHSFIKDNYTELNLSLYYSCMVVFRGEREPTATHPETLSVPSHQFYFQRCAYASRDWPGGSPNRTIILGKNMGTIMKQIEALL